MVLFIMIELERVAGKQSWLLEFACFVEGDESDRAQDSSNVLLH